MGAVTEWLSVMPPEDLPSVCVVTQPIGETDPTATADLLSILSSLTAVSLVTIALPDDSHLWSEYEIEEVSELSMGASIPVAAVRFVRNQFRMARVIRRREEELILFYGSMTYILPIVAARLSGKAVVTEPRADVPLSLYLQWKRRVPTIVARILAGGMRVLERTGYQLSDGIISYSPGMANQLGLYSYEEKLYTDGARFVDTKRFYVSKPFPERERVVGFVGRFAEEKGIRTLASVATKLPDDITFRFVGDGPLRDWLQRKVESEIDAGAVEIRGWVDHDEVPDELNELQLLVMPSEPTEGLPTLIIEAMACGTPVYATDVSGVPDIVRDAETGLLMSSRDPTEISNRISEFVGGDEICEWSRTSRALIESKYTFDEAVQRYDSMLRTIWERNHR